MKSVNKNKRRLMIAVITTIFLILFSMWMFTKATEDVGEDAEVTEESEKTYTPYRNNILGVAGDFCVFTYGDADLSEVTADVAVGGNFKAQSFGNYETGWSNFYKNHLECVNLNSYIGGKYESGTYQWKASKTKEELTCSTDGTCKGTYKGNHQYGQANLYINTEDSKNTIDDQHNPNQCKINDNYYENTICQDENCTHDGKYSAYNVIECDYNFIDFEKEFENLSNISSTLMENKKAIQVDCKNEDQNHTYTYKIPDELDMVIINVDADNFFDATKCDTFNIDGLNKNKKIVINVDCNEHLSEKCPTTPQIKVNGKADDWNYLAENIIWNFYCDNYTDNAQIEAKEIIGTILAPNLAVYINGNLDGAILAREATTDNAIYGMNSDIGWDDISKILPEETSVTVEKVWIDGNDKDKNRPDEIKLQLLADDEKIATITLNKDKTAKIEQVKKEDSDKKFENKIEVSEEIKDNKWICKITKLPKYQNDKEIEYTVKEEKVSDDYKTTIEKVENKEDEKDQEKKEVKYIITNTLLTEIKGEKVWEDESDTDGFRPSEIQVTLYRKNSDNTEKKVAGITNPIKVKSSSNGNKWSYKFEKVAKYDKDNKEINYIVKEEINDKTAKEKYTTEIKAFTITNKHEVEKTSVKVTKKWNDGNDQEGIRPDKVKVTLKSNVKDIKEQTVELSDENKWTYTFEDLQKYKDGKEIKYTVEEEKIPGYTAEIDDDFVITNTHEIGKTEVSGTKTWVDGDNANGARPESIVVKLLANGKEIDSKEVTQADNWKYSFENLDIYENGEKITYTVDEEAVAGYKKEIEGYNITNTYEINTMKINGTKTWIDRGFEDIRPEEITVNLLANGEIIDTKKVTAEDEWKYEFDDLEIYKDGEEIKYTVSEEEIDGYETIIDGYNITNRYSLVAGDEAIDVKVTKKWADEGYENARPEEITVNLLANGEVVRTQKITADNNWEYTFRQLPNFDEEGNEIEYTVTEEEISGYETTINDFEITNTYIPPVVQNVPGKFVIKINKYEKGNTKKLEGAKFEIVIKDDDGKEVLKKTKTTNSVGQIELKDLELDNGKYTIEIKEKEAPKGYIKSTDTIKIEFTVKEEDGKKVIELSGKNKNVEINKNTITIKIENTKEKKTDKTTAKGKMPQTGLESIFAKVMIVVVFMVIGIIGIIKYREIKF